MRPEVDELPMGGCRDSPEVDELPMANHHSPWRVHHGEWQIAYIP